MLYILANSPVASITLQQLRVFLAVVEHGSFTRGAQAVFMTQSAASQHVRSLEHLLGAPLVERAAGELVPTRAGEGLVRYAREMLRLAGEAERFVTAVRNGQAGQLSLGACGSATSLVPALVSAFRTASTTEVDITLQIMPRDALVDTVAGGSLDVGLISGPVHDPQLVGERLCPDRLVLIAAPSSPLLPGAMLAPLALSRIAAEPLVAPPATAPGWQVVERWAAEQGIYLRPAHRFDGPEAIKRAVEAGLGIAFLSAWAVERELALGTLRAVPVDAPPLRRHYEIIRHAGRQVDGLVTSFLRFAPNYLSRRLPALVAEVAEAAAPDREPLPVGK
ncbi:MAG: LysR family transcriptional regulator [Chloroflexi bacterium]|nr:LysR family transcriptional regulator [Chloroflexota bacterium]